MQKITENVNKSVQNLGVSECVETPAAHHPYHTDSTKITATGKSRVPVRQNGRTSQKVASSYTSLAHRSHVARRVRVCTP